MPTPEDEMCACGHPLHYSLHEMRRLVEMLIRDHGPEVLVRVGNRAWMVQRHYIALHGLRAVELPSLGFREVTDEKG